MMRSLMLALVPFAALAQAPIELEDLGRFEQAAAGYERLGQPDGLRRAARLRDSLCEPKKAAGDLVRWLQRWPRADGAQDVALALGELYERLGQPRKALKAYVRASADGAVALLKARLAAELFEGARLPSTNEGEAFKKALEAKALLHRAAEEAYQAVAQRGDAGRSVCAGVGVAELYYGFARELRELAPPPDMSPEQKLQFQSLRLGIWEPIEEKGHGAMEAALQSAQARGVYNACAHRAAVAVRKIHKNAPPPPPADLTVVDEASPPVARGLALLPEQPALAALIFERAEPSVAALTNLGVALARAGDHPGAVAAWKRAIALDASAVAPRLDLAAVLMAFVDVIGARDHYRAVLDSEPTNERASAGLASIQKALTP